MYAGPFNIIRVAKPRFKKVEVIFSSEEDENIYVNPIRFKSLVAFPPNLVLAFNQIIYPLLIDINLLSEEIGFESLGLFIPPVFVTIESDLEILAFESLGLFIPPVFVTIESDLEILSFESLGLFIPPVFVTIESDLEILAFESLGERFYPLRELLVESYLVDIILDTLGMHIVPITATIENVVLFDLTITGIREYPLREGMVVISFEDFLGLFTGPVVSGENANLISLASFNSIYLN